MKYPWKRFWCPREGRMNLSDGGFLYDPEGKYASWVQSDVVPFEKISARPCLALLGEPGIGKSTVMEELCAALEADIKSSGDQFLYINLNEYGDETRLIQALFDSSEFIAWRAGSHLLHLLLDSLDECRIQVPHVGTILANHLQQVQSRLKCLRLRIACRTADWPSVLEARLPKLWPSDDFGAYELAPLRRKDVEMAARAEGVDGATFIEALGKVEVIPLAIKPVTLRFLLSIFKERAALPTTRTELYESGCELLCEEQNPHRQDLRRVGGSGELSGKDRLNVASRIAAISMFCQKPIIHTEAAGDVRSTDEIMVSELANHVHADTARTQMVSEDDIREALGTGLFSSRGPDRMGFAHQTYGEFLASRYLELKSIGSQKKLTLLQHLGGLEAHIVPQLYQTAAWVASHDKTIFDQIATNEPQVLLRCDEATLSPDQRFQLVDEFLKALDTGRTNDRDQDLHRNYAKLSHPTLADQLGSWIKNAGKGSLARNAAIDIVEACIVKELQVALADIALDGREEERLRSNAAHALASVGDKDTRSRLRPLAFGEAGEDPWDNLKGNALRAVWPDIITADELFASLTPPRHESYLGMYLYFAEYELSKHLDAGSLPSALRWLKSHAAEREPTWSFNQLADEIVILAWKHMDAPDVLSGLASASLGLMTHYHELIADEEKIDENSSLFDDVNKRRRLTQAIVAQGVTIDAIFNLVTERTSPRIVRADDLEWCVEQLLASTSQPAESVWAMVVWNLFNWAEPSGATYDLIFYARTESRELEKESRSLFTPVELGSQEARLLKERYEKSQKWQQKKEPKLLDWLPRDRIQRWLTRFEEGNQNAWWMLLREMVLEDTSESYQDLFNPDITALPGWKNSDEKTRARILEGAVTYLNAKNAFDDAGLLDGKGDEKDIAACKAFILLLKERPDNLDDLSDGVWAYWTPVLFGPFRFNENEGIQKLLISIAHGKVPDRVLEVLTRNLQHQIQKGDQHFSAVELVEDIWDRRMSDTTYGLLEQAEANPLCWGRLLAILRAHGDARAVELASARLSLPVPQDDTRRGIALQAALALIRSTDEAGWGIVSPVLQNDPDFGCELMREFAYSLHNNIGQFASRLTEDDLADLFIWLVRHFPYSADPYYDDVYSPTKDDAARDLRNALVNILEKAGTPASYQALRRVASELPELGWLKTVVLEARKNMLESTWRPLRPEEFLQITSQPGSVLVRDANELQETLVEALQGLQGVLQGETFAAHDLWDERTKKRFRPKDENHLSDWIKRNLESEFKKRGIVVAREVEIRRGEKTDIHVTAVIPGIAEDTFDQVRVIIETKGCWHPELETAMEAQLVNRYLKDAACQHGIYLVGWYDCDQWDTEDSRRKKCARWSLEGAKALLEAQAHGLSSAGVSIQVVVLNAALR